MVSKAVQSKVGSNISERRSHLDSMQSDNAARDSATPFVMTRRAHGFAEIDCHLDLHLERHFGELDVHPVARHIFPLIAVQHRLALSDSPHAFPLRKSSVDILGIEPEIDKECSMLQTAQQTIRDERLDLEELAVVTEHESCVEFHVDEPVQARLRDPH